MDNQINLFKTSRGQAQYFEAYDAALQLWPITHESRFVTTPYGQTHIISSGPEGAFPLILLHAGQASSTMWFPNIAKLSEKFHILAFDTPGEPGKSVPIRHNATRRDCADWLEGVMDELGISKAHVMGLSRRVASFKSCYAIAKPPGTNCAAQPRGILRRAEPVLYSLGPGCDARTNAVCLKICAELMGGTRLRCK